MRRPTPLRPHSIWLFVCLLGVAAGFGVVHVWPAGAALRTPLPLPFGAMVAIVAICELCMFEIRFRTDSHTFSLSEFALALGIVFVPPGRFLLAQIVGLAITFALRRRTPIRAVFNVANATFTGALAITLTRAAAENSLAADRPRFWLAALAGLLVGAATSSLLISCVRSIAERRWLHREAPRLALFTALNALAVGSTGILLAIVALALPGMAPAALLPLALTYTASRLFVREYSARTNVEFLYEATKTLHRSVDIDHDLLELLEGTRTVFRAEMAMIAISRSDGTTWLRFQAGPTETPLADTWTPTWVPANDEPLAISAAQGSAGRTLLRELGVQHGLVRRLRGDAGMLGLLVVADRVGGVHAFGDDEKQLFDRLADQVAVGLSNTHLERSLSQLSKLEDDLRFQANHDALTGLANRALLSSTLGSHDTPRTVLLIDLDDFKTINDSLGHAAGDDVLVQVANRLRACVRNNDLIARLGGDEFAILLESASGGDTLTAATETAHRIAEALAPPMRIADNDLTVRGSVGVAYAEPGQSLGDALRNADIAMYEAKQAGKGTHRVFETSMVETARERLKIVNGIRLALLRDEFALLYQPIVDLATNECVAVEALVRWEHPELGQLLPARFVRIAEESGLIVEIGRWVLRRGCEDIAALRTRDGTPLHLTVNVAVRQLLEPGFVQMLEATLASTGFSADRLVLEITETTALDDSPAVLSAVSSVRELGVRLALDDFGTGYSSLAVVHGFPLDLLKIDKLFIRSDDLSLAKAIVVLANSLGLTTVAEGIEGTAQMDALRSMGCNLGQGYAFSRPVPLDVLADRIGRSFGPNAEMLTQGQLSAAQ
jgi:diguanylate cyclase (GGDEF)-like protein